MRTSPRTPRSNATGPDRHRPTLPLVGLIVVLAALLIGATACSSGGSSGTTTTTTAGPTTSGVKPVSTLTKADIEQMQAWLDQVGCDAGKNDGIIGPETLNALKAFQTSAGLSVDGIYGPKTKAALEADAKAGRRICSLPTPTPAPVGPTGAGAACTSDAIANALTGTFGTSVPTKLDAFGCDAGWAYAHVTLGPNSDGSTIDVTTVLAARDGNWVVQDRGVVCPSGSMPKDIQSAGCGTA